MRKAGWITGVVAVIALGTVPLKTQVSAGQISQQTGKQGSNNPQSPRGPLMDKDGGPDPMRDRMEEQASRNRNTERFKRMVSDTDKLLALSTELKADVDKTTKNEMSMDVIKKAAEIEKLAHDVKERMRGQ